MYRESELPAARALHSPESIGMATFLGSPLAGAALLAINERRVGRPRDAWKALAVGVGVTAALLALSAALPASMPSGAFGGVSIGLAIGARTFAKDWFRKATESGHVGEVRYITRWAAAGVGLVSVALVMGALFAVMTLTEHTLPHVEPRPGAKLFYEGASAAEATRVGALLRDEGLFAGTQSADVRYERVASGHALSVIVDEARATPELRQEFQELARRLQPTTDPHGTLTLRLCDDAWTPHHELRAP